MRKSLIAVLLISMLLIDAAESWRRIRIRFRARRVIRRIIKPICKLACPRICQWVIGKGGVRKYICKLGCKKVCGKRKREAIDGVHVTPLPPYMSYYDIDEDGFVHIEEFAITLGQSSTEEGLAMCFTLSDIDGDNRLSEDELINSPCLEFAVNMDTADVEDTMEDPNAPAEVPSEVPAGVPSDAPVEVPSEVPAEVPAEE